MARRKSSEPLRKITLNVFERDYNRLRDLHPEHGPQGVIRAVIRAYIQRIDQLSARNEPLVSELELDLEEL